MQTLEELRTHQQSVFQKAYPVLVKNEVVGGELNQRQGCLQNLVLIEIDTQLLRVFVGDDERQQYPVSTSWRGAGCRDGSACTPLGWHKIDKKIGDKAPLGTVFKGRKACAMATDLSSADCGDLITSRILWLQGMQPGYNQGGGVDSRSRYIYIHGTAQEQLIGMPVSVGCVRLRNSDVIALFDRLRIGDCVYISQHSLQ